MTAIDYSFARPTPSEIAQAGLSGVLIYTGPARPDKDYVDALRAQGLTVCLIQESDPNRSQAGFQAGVDDAHYANNRALEIEYPSNCAICYVVSDGDANTPSSGGDQITQYAAGVAYVGMRPRFYYGNVYATDAAMAGDPAALGTWIPSTWGTGTLLTQEANMASPVADTDLNTIHAPYGAWGGQEDDEMTEQDWQKLGQWMQEQTTLIIKRVDQHFNDEWGWITQNADPLLRDIQKKVTK